MDKFFFFFFNKEPYQWVLNCFLYYTLTAAMKGQRVWGENNKKYIFSSFYSGAILMAAERLLEMVANTICSAIYFSFFF